MCLTATVFAATVCKDACLPFHTLLCRLQMDEPFALPAYHTTPCSSICRWTTGGWQWAAPTAWFKSQTCDGGRWWTAS